MVTRNIWEYSVLQVLPDKIGRFLFEYHSELCNSLNLPDLPADRSSVDVHRLLSPREVSNTISIFAYFIYVCIFHIFDTVFILCIFDKFYIFYIFDAEYECSQVRALLDTLQEVNLARSKGHI